MKGNGQYMKKFIKVLFLLVGIVILLGIIFFIIDNNRIRKQESPIFCRTYEDGGTKEYLGLGYKEKDFNLLNGYDDIKEESSFYGKVIEANEKTIIVEPNEDEEIRKSADKIAIGLGENNDAIYVVGTNVKITYDGTVMESYPAQVKATKIELKSAEDFEIVFYATQTMEDNKVYTILDKTETDKYNYTIYGCNGNVNIRIDGKDYSLREALMQSKITMEEIIAKANKDLEANKITGDMLNDGGTMLYKYDNYTIIKYHTVNGNRDVYIGTTDMNYHVGEQ